MPTIHRQDGFRLVIYTKDHQPAHVHCVRGSAVVVLNLATADDGPTIRKLSRHVKANDLADALRLVNENHFKLWDAWRQYHGE